MTPEQKQIAIAEFEGWSDISKYTQAKDGWYGYEPNNGPHSKLPPYLTSRDAICGAVGKLDDLRLREYAKHLQEVCHLHCVGIVPDYRRDLRNLAKITLATASQMADALLLTLRYQI
jgi:hypothetical protein